MNEQRFSYHHGVAPIMWVLVALCALELLVTHLVVSLLVGRIVAIVLSLASLAAIGWIVAVIASMKRLPVLLDDKVLTMRVGRMKSVAVPVGTIVGLRSGWTAADLKQRSVLQLSLVAYPNIVVDLQTPLPGRRGVTTIAHRLDDPAAFATAVQRLRERND